MIREAIGGTKAKDALDGIAEWLELGEHWNNYVIDTRIVVSLSETGRFPGLDSLVPYD